VHDYLEGEDIENRIFPSKRLGKQENKTFITCPCLGHMVWYAWVHGAVLVAVPCTGAHEVALPL